MIGNDRKTTIYNFEFVNVRMCTWEHFNPFVSREIIGTYCNACSVSSLVHLIHRSGFNENQISYCDSLILSKLLLISSTKTISTGIISIKGAIMFQYYIKIVPTLYQRRDSTIFSTNQFSVTKHKVLSLDRGPSGTPGIFFSYEFSPIMIKMTEKPRFLGHLFTQFLCNISGVFICFWIIDIFMYKVSKVYNIRKKHLPDTTN